MSLHQLNGRVTKLETQTAVQPATVWQGRTLIVWRRREEPETEALERWDIDPAQWGRVVWRLAETCRQDPERGYPPTWLPGPTEDWGAALHLAHAELEARRRQRPA